jgi:hypothetical protein
MKRTTRQRPQRDGYDWIALALRAGAIVVAVIHIFLR